MRGQRSPGTGASAWSEFCEAHGDASGDANAHREGRGQARGARQDAAPGGPLWKVWFWRVLLPQRVTLTRRGMFESFGVCQSPGSIKVARARSGKRGYSAIPGTANIPAMDLLEEIHGRDMNCPQTSPRLFSSSSFHCGWMHL